MKIEFLFAYDDYSWSTEVIEVPTHIAIYSDRIISWAYDSLLRLQRYQGVVYIGIYNDNPEEMESESSEPSSLCTDRQ